MPEIKVVEGVDYCTRWPDQIWGLDLRACCAALKFDASRVDAFFTEAAAL